MLGHEHVRATVAALLAQRVPVRLAAVRAALGVTSPVDPDPDAGYLLADGLPRAEGAYPVVVVQTTDLAGAETTGPAVGGQAQRWRTVYGLRVVVACSAATVADFAAASRDRDRLLLAVREALMATRGAGALTWNPAELRETTGAAAETLAGRPLAAGQLDLPVRCIEVLDPLPVPAPVAGGGITAGPRDASQDL